MYGRGGRRKEEGEEELKRRRAKERQEEARRGTERKEREGEGRETGEGGTTYSLLNQNQRTECYSRISDLHFFRHTA
jgi:hypothetical protein